MRSPIKERRQWDGVIRNGRKWEQISRGHVKQMVLEVIALEVASTLILYNDGSTNTPIPYSSIIPVTSSASTTPSITTSAAAETQSVGQAAYTDLLPPSVPTPTNTGSSTTTSSADSSRMVPWLVGAIGGFTAILIFIALCYSMIWRRSKRHNAMRLASDDGHVKASNTPGSYGMRHIQGKFSQHNQFMSGSTNSKVSSKGETTTSVPPPAQHISPLPKDDANHTSNNSNGGEGNSPGGSRPPTGSRVATALSMYTLDLDPFRALKRVVSGRKKANDDGNLAVSAV
ncbi:hypothetical protein FRC17_003371 [Serendipita sp. 399]|nr:hypothetical protein FRC17_003371 [Serendipita sp. 399]